MGQALESIPTHMSLLSFFKMRRDVNLVEEVRKNIPNRERDVSDTCEHRGVFAVLPVGLV